MEEKVGLAVASLVCGIVSTAVSALAIPIGIFWPIWGCVTSAIGLSIGIVAIATGYQARTYYPYGRATAGFVLGIIGTSLHALIAICFLVLSFVI